MRDLEIKLTSQYDMGEMLVKVDDKPVNLKRNKSGGLIGSCQTENHKVKIQVYRLLDVGGTLWFITQLLFFLVSIFGIFDARHKEKCVVMEYEADVELGENNSITLKLNQQKENEKAVTVETTLAVEELTNRYFVDTKAKKKLKWLKLSKLFLTLGIIAIIIAVLVVKFM